MLEHLTVALVIPLQGSAGIFGPSCEACAQLAAEEINDQGGIRGKELKFITVDGGREPEVVARDIEFLMSMNAIEAVVGWHISAVRMAITQKTRGRIPYIYGALHEGPDHTSGLFMTGESPLNQLVPAMHWLRGELSIQNWAIVGNDYIWPQKSARYAKKVKGRGNISIVSDHYFPLGTTDFSKFCENLDSSKIDGVLMLLVGDDAIAFNREFAQVGLDAEVARFSPIVEENILLAGGAHANRNLYMASGYFDALSTTGSKDFAGRYYTRFGDHAPMLNSIGQSCYETVRLLATLSELGGVVDIANFARVAENLVYEGARGRMRLVGNQVDHDIYLAESVGLAPTVLAQISS
jgi:ABC-type branched-subunit amino acid transport system substrate-binding protein